MTLSTRETYQNPWTMVREAVVRLSDGRTTLYGVIAIGECVGMLPLADAGRVLPVLRNGARE